MKNLKKVLAVIMAVAMLFALSSTAFATTTVGSLVVAPNQLYSVPISRGGTVTLRICAGDAGYGRIGFESADEAESALTASPNYGGNYISSTFTYGSEPYTEGGVTRYCATVTVTSAVAANSDVYGPTSIRLTSTANSSAYIDMTVYHEPINPKTATDVYVEILDVRFDNDLYSGFFEYYGGTVAGAGNYTTTIFDDMDATAQYYPTPVACLAKMVSNSIISCSAYGGYVSAIDIANTAEEDMTLFAYLDGNFNYNYWHCAIVRNGVIVKEDEMAITSTFVVTIESEDYVYWMFGTDDEVETYLVDILEYTHSTN